MIKFSQIVQWDPLQAGSCVILIISIVFGVLLVVHEDALGSFCAPQAWSHPHQEKTLEHPLDCQEIQLLHPKGNHSWVFIGRTDAEVETPIFWPPDEKNWLIWKDPELGKIEGRRRRGQQRMRWLDGITNSMDMSLSSLGSWWWTGTPDVLRFMGSQRVGHNWATELSWTETFRMTPF